MYLAGIDVGTTNTKTIIFDMESGQVRSVGKSTGEAEQGIPSGMGPRRFPRRLLF